MPAGYFREQNGVSVYGKFDGFVYLSATAATTSLVRLGSMSISGLCRNTDLILVETKFTKNTTSGTASVVLFLGPNASTSDEQIGIFRTTNTTQTVLPIFRTIRLTGTQCAVTGSTTSQILDLVSPEQKIMDFDLSTNSTDYYLSVWGQSSVGNTITCQYISVSVLPGVTQSL